MHKTTFEYLQPTETQKIDMQACREAATAFEDILSFRVPDGPDKTYLLRKFREVAMWANIAITRNPDGSPRQ